MAADSELEEMGHEEDGVSKQDVPEVVQKGLGKAATDVIACFLDLRKRGYVVHAQSLMLTTTHDGKPYYTRIEVNPDAD